MLVACTLAVSDKNNSAELLVESNTDEETDLVTAIRKCGIFKKVYYINQAEAWKEINKLDTDSSETEILEATRSTVHFWNEHFVHFACISKRYDEINIMEDHFTLGMALAYLKIPYNYYEESPGCHYRRDVFIQLSEEHISNKAFAPVTKLFGLRGSYPYAVSFNYDFSLNPMKRGEKDRDFSLVKELIRMKKIKPGNFEMIKQVFAPNGYFGDYCEERYEKDKGNLLLIGQHYSDFTYSNTNTIRYVLSLIVDYFGSDMNLWFKNHPSNYFNPMQSWFPDANYINDKTPLELMAADNILHFDRVAAISSSAPLTMHSLDTEVILFQNKEDGDSFESQKRFLDLHKYFVIAKLIERIGVDFTIDSFYTCEIEPYSLQYLIRYQSIDVPSVELLQEIDDIKHLKKESNGIRCFFIDRVKRPFSDEQKLKNEVAEWLFSCDENDVVFFANGDKRNVFFDVDHCEVAEYLYPLPINLIDSSGTSGLFGYGDPEFPLVNTIEKLHQESYGNYSNVERQMIYMYTKNTDVSKMVLSHSIKKNMQHCGIELIYNPTSINYRELLFESMLEQLEQQYIDLQEENEQLRQQLANVIDEENIRTFIPLNQEEITKEIVESINASSTMLMDRMTEIDERIIRLNSWYGFKIRVKEKLATIFKTKQ